MPVSGGFYEAGSEIFSQSRDSVTTKAEFESFRRVGYRGEWYWLIFGRKSDLQRCHDCTTQRNQPSTLQIRTDSFMVLFSISLENHSKPNSSRGPLENHLTTYLSNPISPKAKSPTKKQEDVRPYVTAIRYEGTVEIPALNASSIRPRAPTTRPMTNRHRRNTYDISPAH